MLNGRDFVIFAAHREIKIIETTFKINSSQEVFTQVVKTSLSINILLIIFNYK